MAAAGAEVVRTPADDRMAGAVARADRDRRLHSGRLGSLSQFTNPVNPRTHYETTGPEIAEQIGGRIDAWVAGVGTTGTFIGVARYLTERHPGILRVAVEPAGLDPRRRAAPARTRSRASASRRSGRFSTGA